MRWRACLVILVVAGLASCSDDGDGGDLDVGSVTATFQEPRALDGSVYTVSGHGTVLVRDATSEQMCAHRADGPACAASAVSCASTRPERESSSPATISTSRCPTAPVPTASGGRR